MTVYRSNLSVAQTQEIIDAVGQPCNCDVDTFRQEINETADLCSWPSAKLSKASVGLGRILKKADALTKAHESYVQLGFRLPGTTIRRELQDCLLPNKFDFHRTPEWLSARAPSSAHTLGDDFESWLQQKGHEKQKIDRLIADRKGKRGEDKSWMPFVRSLLNLFRKRFDLEPTTTPEGPVSIFVSVVLIRCGHSLDVSGARARILKIRAA